MRKTGCALLAPAAVISMAACTVGETSSGKGGGTFTTVDATHQLSAGAYPVHPYTRCLLSAIPVMRGLEREGTQRQVPLAALDEREEPPGCLFAPRVPVRSAGMQR